MENKIWDEFLLSIDMALPFRPIFSKLTLARFSFGCE